MQLDRTGVVIRERGLFDLLDLALRMLTRYVRPLALAWVMAAVPLMVLNHVLLPQVDDFDDLGQVMGHVNSLVLLVVIQAPLVSLLMTTFLGRAVFLTDSKPKEWFQAVWRCLWPLMWYVGLWRGAALGWGVVGLAHESTTELNGLLLVLAAFAVGSRIMSPFMPEIILLEGNPMRAKSSSDVTIVRRSRGLHKPNLGELVGRWLGAAAVAAAMFGCLVATYWFFAGMVLLNWDWGPVMVYLIIPLALWAAAGFLAIVRFLCYIDLRIRCEGWEVELLLRAAGDQLAQQEQGLSVAG